MREIHASHLFAAPATAVFEALSDHERFLSGADLRCTLVREGAQERNGLGALREVHTSGMVMSEEITAFERPHGFDYVIRSASRGGRALPLRHERGWLALAPEAGGTRVDWRSRISIPVPLIGGMLERLFERKAKMAFEKLLQRADKGLARSS